MRALKYACVLLAGCATSKGAASDAGGDDDVATPDARDVDGAVVPPDAIPIDATVPDASTAGGSFTDDVAGDFQSSAITDAVVEGFGAIAPVAYYTGGLLWHGSDDGFFTDGPSATWTQVQGFTPTARTAITWLTQGFWGPDTPPSVGLTNPDNFSEWFEGEVFLDAGTWTFTLLVDDHGFLEIAPPGTAAYQRVLSANWAVEGAGTFNAGAAGWYPIRFAIAEQAGDAQYNLRVSGPGVTQRPIPRDRMRVRADQLQGLIEAGFDDSHGVGDLETTIDAIGPGNTDWNTGNPGDLGMTASDTFSVRWAGQVRMDTAGSYSFRYVTDDGQRLWIDGVKRLDTWDDSTHNAVTPVIALDAGWHDLVIEQTEAGGGAIAVLTVETGPALVGAALPIALLRPVEGRAERIASGVNHTDVAIPDVTTVQSTTVLSGPPGATVSSVDVTYQFSHTYPGDLVITLQAPNGVVYPLRNRTGGDPDVVNLVERWTISMPGAQLDGTWTLVVADQAGSDAGTLEDFEVTPHWSGGQAPIPTSASFESTVRDLGASVTSIDTVTWGERIPAGADIAVRVRTCAVPGDCAGAAWSAAITTPGGTPAVAPARYLQYRVELSSNGDRAPVLDWLTVDYTLTN